MVMIDESRCVGCGRCAADCVGGNLRLEAGKVRVKGDCILCGHCVAVCPAGAVSIAAYQMDQVEECRPGEDSLDPGALLRAVKGRRSIRHFQKRPVEREKLERMAEAGRYTATAKNLQDTGFVFVQEELEELKRQVWEFIEVIPRSRDQRTPRELLPYVAFNRRRKANPEDDFLFRNAPVVVFITCPRGLDAGMAAQNMELMAEAQGLGVLFDGYLAHIADANGELKQWLGIEKETIQACLLLGYSQVRYCRTAPRRKADPIWK